MLRSRSKGLLRPRSRMCNGPRMFCCLVVCLGVIFALEWPHLEDPKTSPTLSPVMNVTPCAHAGRSPSLPFSTGDGFRCRADFLFDETTDGQLHPQLTVPQHRVVIVFVKTDLVIEFMTKLHPVICPLVREKGYILLIHNSDMSPPVNLTQAILPDQCLLRIYSQNVPPELAHPKLSALPIGLENMHWNRQFPWLYDVPRKPFHDRSIGVLLSGAIYNADRREAVAALANRSFVSTMIGKGSVNQSQFISILGDSKFVVSPRGNGLDSHRTWEAFARGCILLQKRDTLSHETLDGMPVILVDRWSDILSLDWLLHRVKSLQLLDRDGYVRFSKPKHLFSFYLQQFAALGA